MLCYPYQASTQIEKEEKKNPNLNTKHKGEQKPYLKETVGVGISNLNAKNPTWSQLSILYKIKTGTKLIKKKTKSKSKIVRVSRFSLVRVSYYKSLGLFDFNIWFPQQMKPMRLTKKKDENLVDSDGG